MSEDQATLDGPPRETAAEPARLDESAMFRLLSGRFPSGSYALLRHVANGTGSRSYRWADAVAMGTWPSRGLDERAASTRPASPRRSKVSIGRRCTWRALP